MIVRFIRKRTVWLPTWQGWLAVCLVTGVLAVAAVRSIHPLLAVSAAAEADTLVVDGWLPDDTLRDVVAEFRRGRYARLCTTGGPLSHGSYLSKYGNYAQLMAANLRALGFDTERLIVAPSAGVTTNRTFESAWALREAFDRQGVAVQGLNLMTRGLHARRSWMVYRKVFGPGVRVGVISCPPHDYLPAKWWQSSAGLKGVIGETIATGYEWLCDSGR
jgi:hypothetical protein